MAVVLGALELKIGVEPHILPCVQVQVVVDRIFGTERCESWPTLSCGLYQCQLS